MYTGVLRSTSLALCLMNTQSIKNKIADFVDYVSKCKLDLVAITETWLTSNFDFFRAQLCPNGYRFFDKPQKDGRGGGTAILFNDSLKVSFSQSGHTE